MRFRDVLVSLMPAACVVTAALAAPPVHTVSLPTTAPTQPVVGLANPASVNCLTQGGNLQLRQAARGSYGVCVFKGGRECEEWALFRGECPKGGLPPASQDKRKASEGSR